MSFLQLIANERLRLVYQNRSIRYSKRSDTLRPRISQMNVETRRSRVKAVSFFTFVSTELSVKPRGQSVNATPISTASMTYIIFASKWLDAEEDLSMTNLCV